MKNGMCARVVVGGGRLGAPLKSGGGVRQRRLQGPVCVEFDVESELQRDLIFDLRLIRGLG